MYIDKYILKYKETSSIVGEIHCFQVRNQNIGLKIDVNLGQAVNIIQASRSNGGSK